MEKILGLIFALGFTISACAQDVAVNTLYHHAEEVKLEKESAKMAYSYDVYGEIPNVTPAFPSDHYLGGSITAKWNTFVENYTNEYSVSVGLSDSGIEIVKPAVYNAVERANKYVKKALKKGEMSKEEAIQQMAHILDCANVICFESETAEFEREAKDAKEGKDVIELFKKVSLVKR